MTFDNKAKKLTPRRVAAAKKKFLDVFVETCNLSKSARLCGISRSTHYEWLRLDREYAQAFDLAVPDAIQAFDDELMEWARVGVFEPVVYKGKIQRGPRKRTLCMLKDGSTAFDDELPEGAEVTDKREVMTPDGEIIGVYKKSERIALAVAARWMPAKYGRLEVTGKDGAAFIPSEIRVVFTGTPGSVLLREGDQNPVRAVIP